MLFLITSYLPIMIRILIIKILYSTLILLFLIQGYFQDLDGVIVAGITLIENMLTPSHTFPSLRSSLYQIVYL